MEIEIWATQIAKILTYFLVGGFVVPTVYWIKGVTNLSGYWALGLTVLTSILFGAAGLVAEGALLPGDITPENLYTVFLAVFLASQVVYNMLKEPPEMVVVDGVVLPVNQDD